METAVETLSTSSAERRFSNSNSDSTMMTMMGPLTHRATTAICHTSTITSSTTVSTTATNTYELRLTTAQQEMETEADTNEKKKKDGGEEEEMQGLEFLRDCDIEDGGDVHVSTQSDSDSDSVSSKLSHRDRHLLSFREAVGDMVADPDEFRSDESIDREIVQIIAGAFEGPNHDQGGRINNADQQSGGGRGGGAVPAAAVAVEVVIDKQQKDLAAAQQQDCIFDYPDPRTTSNHHHNNHSRTSGREDIIAPHAPFFPVLSPTTLRPQRFTKVPVVEEYIDPYCPPTPPPLPLPSVLLPPTPSASSTSSPSSDKLSNAVDTNDVNVIANQKVEDGGGVAESLDKATIDRTNAQEASPLHPLDYPPHHPPQYQQQHLPRDINDGNPSVPPQSSPIPQQQQPDRIRWRLSTNYPPTRRIGGRSAAATSSIYGGGGGDMSADAISIHSSRIAPTTFVMIDTDGNQILTDPYTSSVTPPLPSSLSVAVMGIAPSSGVESGKALPAPVPLWLTNTVPRFHFSGHGGSGHGSSSSSGGTSFGGSAINPTADPQVTAHIADALRMYGIPSLHQSTTVHPFQRFSMTTSSSSPSVPIRATSMGYEPPRGSTFPRLMYPSASRNSSSTVTSSSRPSRVVRIWAALTGRRHTSSSSSTASTGTNTTIAASNHGSSPRTAIEAGTTSSTMTTHFRSSQLAQPPSSSSSSSLATTSSTLQYEQLPFVQQPRRPTVVSPSPLARVSVVLRSSGSSSSARGSVLAADSSVTNGGGVGGSDGGGVGGSDGGGNGEDGDGDGEGEEGGNGQQQQRLSRPMPQNADDADNNDDDKDHAAAEGGEPSAFQKFLKVLLCGC